MLNITPRALLALVLLVAPAAAQSTVWTVDKAGGGDFTEIQDAVDAAADGDVILIGAGGYAPVHIAGKGLRLHATSLATVFVGAPIDPPEPVLVIEGLGASQAVVVDGLQVFSFQPGVTSAVSVASCAGPVWLHEMFVDSYGAGALRVAASASVVLDRCLFQANASTPSPLGDPQPGPGALVEQGSRLFAYDTDFRGTHGPLFGTGIPLVAAPEDGGAGLVLVDSEARLAGGSLTGGTGSMFDTGTCTTSGDGGAGALLTTAGGTPPTLTVVDVAVQPGSPGFADPGCGTPVAGVAFEVQAGAVQSHAFAARLVAIPLGAVEAGETVQIELSGEPGDLCLLFASGAPAPAIALTAVPAGLQLHLAPAPLVLVHTAALPGFATSFALSSPALPAGFGAATPAVQGLFVDAQGGLHAATPQALALLSR